MTPLEAALGWAEGPFCPTGHTPTDIHVRILASSVRDLQSEVVAWQTVAESERARVKALEQAVEDLADAARAQTADMDANLYCLYAIQSDLKKIEGPDWDEVLGSMRRANEVTVQALEDFEKSRTKGGA